MIEHLPHRHGITLAACLLMGLGLAGPAQAQQKPTGPGPRPAGPTRQYQHTQQKRMGFLLQVYDKGKLLEGPPEVKLRGSMGTKRTLYPKDDGSRQINDIAKGDGVYCHPVLSFPDPSVEVTVISKKLKWTVNTTLDPDDVRALIFVKLGKAGKAEVLPKELALGMAVHVPPKEMGAPRPRFGRKMGKYIEHHDRKHTDKTRTGEKIIEHVDKTRTGEKVVEHQEKKHVDKARTGEKVIEHQEKTHVDKTNTGAKVTEHQERTHVDRRHVDYDSRNKLPPNFGRIMGKQGPPKMGRQMGKSDLLATGIGQGKKKSLIPSMIGQGQDPREGKLGPGFVLWAISFLTVALGFSITVALSGRRPRTAARLAFASEHEPVAPTRLRTEDVAEALSGPLKDYRVVILGELVDAEGRALELDEQGLNIVRCLEDAPLPEELVTAVERTAALGGPPPALLVTDAGRLDRPGPPDPVISLDRRVAARFPLWIVNGPQDWQAWPEQGES